jgi:hypothetical protein
LAQTIFEPHLFLYKYPIILNPHYSSYISAYEEERECSEMLAYKIQVLGNYPKESIQHLEHSVSMKPRISFKMLKLQIAYQQVHVHIAITTAHSDEPPLIYSITVVSSSWAVHTDIHMNI